MHSCSIDLIEVFDSLTFLSSNSSSGPDLIFNVSIQFITLHQYFSGQVENQFYSTYSNVFSDQSIICNNRPISLLPLIPLVFESIVANKVLSDLNNDSNKSTITNLISELMFPDDIKMFRLVTNQAKADFLRSDLNKLYEW